jgi:hypothetical protein
MRMGASNPWTAANAFTGSQDRHVLAVTFMLPPGTLVAMRAQLVLVPLNQGRRPSRTRALYRIVPFRPCYSCVRRVPSPDLCCICVETAPVADCAVSAFRVTRCDGRFIAPPCDICSAPLRNRLRRRDRRTEQVDLARCALLPRDLGRTGSADLRTFLAADALADRTRIPGPEARAGAGHRFLAAGTLAVGLQVPDREQGDYVESAVWAGGQVEKAVVRRDHGLGDRQPQAGAPGVVGGVCLDPFEGLGK